MVEPGGLSLAPATRGLECHRSRIIGQTARERMISKHDLHQIFDEFGPQTTDGLRMHEKYYGELIPHGLMFDIVENIENSADPEKICIRELEAIILQLMQSGDAYLMDLLYASLFPALELHDRVRVEFLASANPEAIKYFQDWSQMP